MIVVGRRIGISLQVWPEQYKYNTNTHSILNLPSLSPTPSSHLLIFPHPPFSSNSLTLCSPSLLLFLTHHLEILTLLFPSPKLVGGVYTHPPTSSTGTFSPVIVVLVPTVSRPAVVAAVCPSMLGPHLPLTEYPVQLLMDPTLLQG